MDTIATIFWGLIVIGWTLFAGFIKLLLGIMYYQDKQRLGEKKAKGAIAQAERELKLAKIFLEES